MYQNID